MAAAAAASPALLSALEGATARLKGFDAGLANSAASAARFCTAFARAESSIARSAEGTRASFTRLGAGASTLASQLKASGNAIGQLNRPVAALATSTRQLTAMVDGSRVAMASFTKSVQTAGAALVQCSRAAQAAAAAAQSSSQQGGGDDGGGGGGGFDFGQALDTASSLIGLAKGGSKFLKRRGLKIPKGLDKGLTRAGNAVDTLTHVHDLAGDVRSGNASKALEDYEEAKKSGRKFLHPDAHKARKRSGTHEEPETSHSAKGRKSTADDKPRKSRTSTSDHHDHADEHETKPRAGKKPAAADHHEHAEPHETRTHKASSAERKPAAPKPRARSGPPMPGRALNKFAKKAIPAASGLFGLYNAYSDAKAGDWGAAAGDAGGVVDSISHLAGPKAAKVLGPVGGVLSGISDSANAYNDFSQGNYGQGIQDVLNVGSDVNQATGGKLGQTLLQRAPQMLEGLLGGGGEAAAVGTEAAALGTEAAAVGGELAAGGLLEGAGAAALGALELTPIGWAGTAIAGAGFLGYEAYEHWDDIKKGASDFGNWLFGGGDDDKKKPNPKPTPAQQKAAIAQQKALAKWMKQPAGPKGPPAPPKGPPAPPKRPPASSGQSDSLLPDWLTTGLDIGAQAFIPGYSLGKDLINTATAASKQSGARPRMPAGMKAPARPPGATPALSGPVICTGSVQATGAITLGPGSGARLSPPPSGRQAMAPMADIRVRFENTPPGTRISARGTGVKLDPGHQFAS